MEKNPTRQYFVIAALLSLAIAITIHFPDVLEYIFRDEGSRERHRFMISFTHLGGHLVITFIVALLMFTLNFFILNPVGVHGRLKLHAFVLAILLTVVSVYVLNEVLFSLLDLIDKEPRPERGRGRRDEFDYTNFFVSGLVIGCVIIMRLIFQKQTISMENETLKREALQSQFESLKNQLSPHFLFNSLTALKTLIRNSPDTAQEYVNSLSRALRYTLKSNEKQLVSLEEEMVFMQSYLFLIRMRFGENLSVNTRIDEDLVSYNIPPLTIQTLIENAIKHNEISKRNPLSIDILTTENKSLIIVNDIHEKITDGEGTGIGLTNLSKQYRLLINKEIIIRKEGNRFSVEVPLIKP